MHRRHAGYRAQSGRGGNPVFTGGVCRFAYDEVKDLMAPDLAIAEPVLSTIDRAMKQRVLFDVRICDSTINLPPRGVYSVRYVTKESGNTLEERVPELTGVDVNAVLGFPHAYNAAPRPDVKFDPNIHDGPRCIGIPINKTNRARKLDTSPYHAYGRIAGDGMAAFARRH